MVFKRFCHVSRTYMCKLKGIIIIECNDDVTLFLIYKYRKIIDLRYEISPKKKNENKLREKDKVLRYVLWLIVNK